MSADGDEHNSLKTDIVGWTAALILVAVVIIFPSWSLAVVFLVAFGYTYCSDTFDREEDVTTAIYSLVWGCGLLIVETLQWFIESFFSDQKIELRDVLIPTNGLPIEYIYSLFAWGALFVSLLLFIRAAWDKWRST